MTKLDRVGRGDNFRGVPSFLLVCEKSSQATREIDEIIAQSAT